MRLWLDKAPLISLIVAAFTFVVGLNLFAFLSSQVRLAFIYGDYADVLSCMFKDPYVVKTTSVLTSLHTCCLFSVAWWLLCQIYRDRKWATFTMSVISGLQSVANETM